MNLAVFKKLDRPVSFRFNERRKCYADLKVGKRYHAFFFVNKFLRFVFKTFS